VHIVTSRNRRHQAERRPRLRLPARREGQFRRGPGAGRADAPGQPGHGAVGTGQPRVRVRRGGEGGPRGRHRAVPRPRCRAARPPGRARCGQGGHPRRPVRQRRPRSGRVLARTGAARQDGGASAYLRRPDRAEDRAWAPGREARHRLRPADRDHHRRRGALPVGLLYAGGDPGVSIPRSGRLVADHLRGARRERGGGRPASAGLCGGDGLPPLARGLRVLLRRHGHRVAGDRRGKALDGRPGHGAAQQRALRAVRRRNQTVTAARRTRRRTRPRAARCRTRAGTSATAAPRPAGPCPRPPTPPRSAPGSRSS
jgi:hypothetical protein